MGNFFFSKAPNTSSFYLSNQNAQIRTTTRLALQKNGRIGSIYNAAYDQVMNQYIDIAEYHSLQANFVEKCEINRIDEQKHFTTFDCIPMEPELSLSVSLKIYTNPDHNILFGEKKLVNKYTRVLRFTICSYIGIIPMNERINCSYYYCDQRNKLNGTHVITSIHYGTDVVLVLQYPSDDCLAANFDQVFDKILTNLKNSKYELDDSAKDTFKSITCLQIYSNISSLNQYKTVMEVYDAIVSMSFRSPNYEPYQYTISSIHDLVYRPNSIYYEWYFEMDEEFRRPIQSYRKTFETGEIEIKMLLQNLIPKFQECCPKQYDLLNQENENCIASIDRWYKEVRQWTIEYRKQRRTTTHMNAILGRKEYLNISEKLDYLKKELKQAREKNFFLIECLPRDWHYEAVGNFNFGANPPDDEIRRNLMGTHGNRIVVCGTDILRETSVSRWNQIEEQVRKAMTKNPKLKIIYADFSYSNYKLQHFIVWGLEEPEAHLGSLPQHISKPASLFSRPFLSDQVINVLLIGESGVGKSTLINALVNHLKYPSFEDALDKPPIIILPVSFVLSTGQDFKEYEVKAEGLDKSNNEDISNSTRSVTQSCRSYTITLPEGTHRGKQIRFIDTPGFNDTRGDDSDQSNIQEILAFIQCFDHLDSICLLLKPNTSRLTIPFRYAVKTLFEGLGEKIWNNLLFCYTNTRSTFYRPGSSKAVLLKFLQELTEIGVQYPKEQSFCFESETFRYLLARYQQVPFENDDAKQAQDSWKHSSRESIRFFDFICEHARPVKMNEFRWNDSRLQLKIHLILRPLLASIKNILRNTIIKESSSRRYLITLIAEELDRPMLIRESQSTPPITVDNFLVEDEEFTDIPHTVCSQENLCYHRLKFKIDQNPSNESVDESNQVLQELKDALFLSGVFLQEIKMGRKDLILEKLEKALATEKNLSHQSNSSSINLNGRLAEKLRELIDNYKKKKQDRHDRRDSIDIGRLNHFIDSALKEKTMRTQWTMIENVFEREFKRKHFILEPSELKTEVYRRVNLT